MNMVGVGVGVGLDLKEEKGRVFQIFILTLFFLFGCKDPINKNTDAVKLEISSVSPSGVLPTYLSTQIIQLKTNIPAICRLNDGLNLVFEEMNNEFSTKEGRKHEALIQVIPNHNYYYFFRCIDPAWSQEINYKLKFTTGKSYVSIPVINSILSQNPSEGIITFTGYNFENRPNFKPLIWDDFEDGLESQTISNNWNLYRSNSSKPVYATDKKYSGKYSIKNTVTYGNKSEFNTAWQEFPLSDEIYASYFFRFNFELNDVGKYSVMKLARITSNYTGLEKYIKNYNGPGSLNIQYQPKNNWLYAYSGGLIEYNQQTINDDNFLPNKWLRVEMYKKLSSEGHELDGKVFIRINNKMSFSMDNIITRSDNYAYKLNSFLLPLMFANPIENTKIDMYVDDVYVDSTLSRVEVGNCPAFEECSKKEVQFPLYWTDNKISVKVGKGKFEEHEPRYLFVIDSKGNVSNGILLDFK